MKAGNDVFMSLKRLPIDCLLNSQIILREQKEIKEMQQAAANGREPALE
jgi:hypothetical protein